MARLLEEGADPALRDMRGRLPYNVAACKEVRDAFRRAMAAQPSRWNWEAAGVPSALTPDLEANQAARQVPRPPYLPLLLRVSSLCGEPSCPLGPPPLPLRVSSL